MLRHEETDIKEAGANNGTKHRKQGQLPNNVGQQTPIFFKRRITTTTKKQGIEETANSHQR